MKRAATPATPAPMPIFAPSLRPEELPELLLPDPVDDVDPGVVLALPLPPVVDEPPALPVATVFAPTAEPTVTVEATPTTLGAKPSLPWQVNITEPMVAPD